MNTGTGSEVHIGIIGSGAAAFACALKAAERGAQVTLIEAADQVGGCCVNVGCVPSKSLIRAGQLAQHKRRTPFSGLEDIPPSVDRPALLKQQAELVQYLRQQKYESLIENHPAIDLLRGRASFLNRDCVSVTKANGATVEFHADRFLVATGSHPFTPSITGLRQTPYWTSTEALLSKAVPRHLAVIGSSMVAVELAQAWRRLGAGVTLLARGALLSREDPVLATLLREAFRSEGIRVLEHCPVEAVLHENDQFSLTTKEGHVAADRLLVATGRQASTHALMLGDIGVATDDQGRVVVDDHLRSSVPHIYAAGDCTQLPQLVYVAAAAGTRAAINMTGGDARLDLSATPRVIFTDPQIATVGFTEAEAERKGLLAESRELALRQVPRAQINQDTQGLIKLVAEVSSGRLLGAQVIAHNAGEVIQSAALAIANGMTVDGIADQLFPYLTMTEGLKLCALAFRQDVTRLSCCAG